MTPPIAVAEKIIEDTLAVSAPTEAPVEAPPLDESTPIKFTLADAIRLGGMDSLPLRRGYLAEDGEGNLYSCALGAAYLGAKKMGLINED